MCNFQVVVSRPRPSAGRVDPTPVHPVSVPGRSPAGAADDVLGAITEAVWLERGPLVLPPHHAVPILLSELVYTYAYTVPGLIAST